MKVAAGPTVLGISFALVSQVAMVLSFFLPLKVIILLGSPKIPSFFPPSWQEMDRNFLVTCFTAGALVAYVLHLFSDSVVRKSAMRGGKMLLVKNNKLNLFPNQSRITSGAHERYSRVIAALIYTTLALSVLGYLYPELLLFLLSYATTVLLVVVVGGNLNYVFRGKLTNQIGKTSQVITSLAFLSVFLFMVLDFMSEPAPGVLVASISIILVRQLLGQLSRVINDIFSLSKSRHQIDAMFFHGQVFDISKVEGTQGFWELFGSDRLLDWVTSSLADTVGANGGSTKLTFLPIPIKNIIGVEALLSDNNNREGDKYLAKVFDAKREPMALQEAALFDGLHGHSLPSLAFVKLLVIDNYQCVLYEMSGKNKLLPEHQEGARLKVRKDLFLYSPPESLISRYSRSSLMLPQRLSQVLERLLLFTNNLDDQSLAEKVIDNLVFFQGRLRCLPKQVVNIDVRINNMLSADDGTIVLVNWHRWSIEPIGAGWPTGDNDIIMLKELCKEVRQGGEIAHDFPEDDVVLSALLYQLERHCVTQDFASAISMLPKILEHAPRDGEGASA
jgi:hypothetical protein